MIVCASRRTDVPAFHSEWMMNRLRAQYAMVRNPVCREVVYKIDLSPKNVDCLIFVTKDPRPMLAHLDEIDDLGYLYTFQVTLTPYGKDIEPNVPFKADIADSFKEISERLGKERILWRYDPIILNDKIDLDYHRRKFEILCKELEGYTDRCVFSFLEMYGKLKDHRDVLRPVIGEEMDSIGETMAGIAKDHGIELNYCCSKHDLSKYGVVPRGCIDKGSARRLGIPYEEYSTPLREGCRCIKNIDIGEYDTCNHNCIYCYANHSDGLKRSKRSYDPESEILYGTITDKDKIAELPSRGFPLLSDM